MSGQMPELPRSPQAFVDREFASMFGMDPSQLNPTPEDELHGHEAARRDLQSLGTAALRSSDVSIEHQLPTYDGSHLGPEYTHESQDTRQTNNSSSQQGQVLATRRNLFGNSIPSGTPEVHASTEDVRSMVGDILVRTAARAKGTKLAEDLITDAKRNMEAWGMWRQYYELMAHYHMMTAYEAYRAIQAQEKKEKQNATDGDSQSTSKRVVKAAGTNVAQPIWKTLSRGDQRPPSSSGSSRPVAKDRKLSRTDPLVNV